MMRINVKRNGFVLTEIAASLLLAACGGSSPTDNGTPSVSDSEVSGVLSETESKALTESLRRKGHLSWSFCAPEGGVCKLALPAFVRYGVGDVFAVRGVRGDIDCSNGACRLANGERRDRSAGGAAVRAA